MDIPGVVQPSGMNQIHTFVGEGKYFVAVREGGIVGAMSLIIEENSCQIYSIASRQKGAGRAMIQHAEEVCRAERIPKLWCWSLARYNAGGFYEKMGFDEVFLMRRQWFGEDCYIFGKVTV